MSSRRLALARRVNTAENRRLVRPLGLAELPFGRRSGCAEWRVPKSPGEKDQRRRPGRHDSQEKSLKRAHELPPQERYLHVSRTKRSKVR
jgi:hypothetical protein